MVKVSTGAKLVGKADPAAITATRMQELFTAAIRAEVGRGRPWTRPALARASGLDASSIASWMNGEAVATAWKLVLLMAVLGPRFTNRILSMAGQTGADWIEVAPVTILSVNAAATNLAARVAGDLADGRIDPSEAATHIELARQLHDLTGDFLASQQQGA